MKRTLFALCATLLLAGLSLGLGAGPAAATIEGQEWLTTASGDRATPGSRQAGRSIRTTRITRTTTRARFKRGRHARLDHRMRRPLTPARVGASFTGVASYYSEFFRGRPTANGERFNPGGLTAAHRTLPFGTRVRVTNLNNGRAVTVRINDRGPFIAGRIIDLAHGAARVVGMTHSGVARVRVAVVSR